MSTAPKPKPRIAVFSGPTATILNSEPLVTGNAARRTYGLPVLMDDTGTPLRFDVLRPQRLAAPVTVYIEQFSAHPLERDAAHLYAPPDGYLDSTGHFHAERTSEADTPVYAVTLSPEDGLYPLPYVARQADGQPWDGEGRSANAPFEEARQPFYPDASRLFEEIDRLGVDSTGRGNTLSSRADFDFYRPAPSGGYTRGLPANQRRDLGEGDIPPERLGVDFFPYRPGHVRHEPPVAMLARSTNVVRAALASGTYVGGMWLEGSPNVEETAYWLNLVLDTPQPFVAHAAQYPHGYISADGDVNIVDGVQYLLSRVWADEEGRDRLGVVVIQDQQIFAARDVQKVDARPGGFKTAGGLGGELGLVGGHVPPTLLYLPTRRHTFTSAVNVRRIPEQVPGLAARTVRVKDEAGRLSEAAMPTVTVVKHARYLQDAGADPQAEVEILARVEKNLRDAPLAGFVLEGTAPYGASSEAKDAALDFAACSSLPVVHVSRGNAGGFTLRPQANHLWIAGNNLTATKARLLLMACLLRYGCPPAATDPWHPTHSERTAIKTHLDAYQEVFDTH